MRNAKRVAVTSVVTQRPAHLAHVHAADHDTAERRHGGDGYTLRVPTAYNLGVRPIREKPHRLPDVFYHGQKRVAFTACENRPQPLLANDAIHAMVCETLADAAARHGCTVPMYCLMPGHLHVLLYGTSPQSHAKNALEGFKWASSMLLAANRPDLEWQEDFYDHIVRRSEGWEVQARYAALNPVRIGLANDIFAWPYTGSIGYDREEVLLDAWW